MISTLALATPFLVIENVVMYLCVYLHKALEWLVLPDS
jgi:hypothetical protein